jgi:hypothetical protein
VPVDAPMWLEGPHNGQSTLEQLFVAARSFPELAKEFAALLARLDEKPAAGVDGRSVRDFVWRSLYSVERMHDLPLLIHLAYGGDLAPLAARVAPKGDSGIPKGVYFSIVCNEDIPRFDPNAVEAAAAGSFWGAARVQRDVSACREWPRGWLPPGFAAPIVSDAPVLLLDGALDHVTPPRYAERVARTLAHARNLTLPRRGHEDVDPCVTGLIETFVLAGDASKLDTSCLAKTPQLSFAAKREELR